MADRDIPIAYGTIVPPDDANNIVHSIMYDPMSTSAYATPVATATNPTTRANSSGIPIRDLRTASLLNGRSSRVMLPDQRLQPPLIATDAMRILEDQGYTKGLAQALMRNKQVFPMSFWVVDNSGSMAHRDGHRLIESSQTNNLRFVDCTRWAEMQQTVDYHAQMAALLKSPTIFRLLNDPGRVSGQQQFSIAERGDEFLDEDLAIAQSTMMNTMPGGVTPLTRHLHEIRSNISAMEPMLRQEGTKVAVILATDGLPTNDYGNSDETVKREFAQALRGLEGLPVWVVVRLCTDEQHVVEYWNNLDGNLELNLEVLDDFVSEATEVYEHNKWLNYGLPLHRMREMGFYHRLFDLLDERALSKDELREFCRILFGDGIMDGVPDPEADWKGFLVSLERLVNRERKQWNPITKRMEPWIDIRRLKRDYGGSGWFW